MVARVVCCSLLLFLGVVLGRPQLDVHVTDDRQVAMLKESVEHHIVVPYSVDSNGNYLSHDLHHHRTRRSLETEEIHYHIPFKNEKFHLMLSRNDDLMIPGLEVEWRSGKRTSPPRDCYFIGSLKNQTGSSAAISNCKGLAGMIRSSDQKDYFIEPVFGIDLKEHDGKHPHVMYRRSVSMEHEKMNKSEPACGVTVEDEMHADHFEEPTLAPKKVIHLKRRQRRTVSIMKHVEVLLVADYAMTKFYENRDLEHYLFTVMNMVKLLFKHRSIGNAINVVLVRMIVLDKEYEEDLNITNHARRTLGDFCSWVQKINPESDQDPKHADSAILVTRRDICRDSYEPCKTLGISNVDGICLTSNGCSYNEDSGFPLVYTVAHELAHNLGSLHDDDYSNCYNMRNHIMASNLIVSPAANVWSKCTRKAVKSFFYKGWGWCLNDKPGRDIQPIRRHILPGEEFGALQQCTSTFGDNSTLCVDTKEGICQTLWCTTPEGYCATKFNGLPALDGTSCGKKKWCIKGRCKIRTPLQRPIDGDWGQWSRWSACSSTCGRGVRRKTRRCKSPRPEFGGNYCVGVWKKYVICNMPRCRAGSASSTDNPCKKFRPLLINGKRHTWTLKENYRTPCELRCIPVLKNGASRIRKFIQAKDGTPCNQGTLNICIQGKCEHVGCDNKLYSGAREDRCGVCRGDGTTCKTKQMNFVKEKGDGYTEAMVIPAGARNIIIQEVYASPNFLALKSSKGNYFLNGNWSIQWEGNYDVGGVDGFYSRRHNKDTFQVKGPIKEDLHVVLLYQAKNPGLNVQYDVKLKGKFSPRSFRWLSGAWGSCSKSCGQGIKTRLVKCVDEKRNIVDDQHCRNKRQHASKSVCSLKICPPSWWVGMWHECSKTCGPAVKFRPVLCTQIIQDRRRVVPDNRCRGSKPNKLANCKQPLCWVTNPWTKCSSLCGPGNQTRKVRCPGAVSRCGIPTKPATNRTCTGELCLNWLVGPWDNCSLPCGNGSQSRNVECESPNESMCDRQKKPSAYQSCPGFECPVWSVGNWTECSVTCGKGIQQRNVTCEHENTTLSCNESERPLAMKSCLQKMCSGWIVGKWTPCSASCGNGKRERKVVCTSKFCKTSLRPRHKEPCNLRDCPKWSVGEWSECSTSCGNGTRHRNVTCSEPDGACSLDTKPLTVEECVQPECSVWNVGNWSECSVSCGDGLQTRLVECNTTVRSLCEENVPATKKSCNEKPCSEWKATPWSDCSKTCGPGVQNRIVSCPDTECNPLTKPNSTQVCNNEDCAVWVTGNWNECSNHCGEGVQTRQVYCSHDDDSECDPFEKPESTQDCFVSRCSEWKVTRWGACSAKCGMGIKKRNVTCTLSDEKCSPKPKAVDVCMAVPCAKWNTGRWGPCTVTCGLGVHRRIVSCIGGRCLPSTKPASTKSCRRPECPVWQIGNWSECSVSCGNGSQTRAVYCTTGHVGEACSNDDKPITKRPCDNRACPYWTTGAWGNCSSTCGNGTQSRQVTCITNATLCQNTSKPVTERACFADQCSIWTVGNWSGCSVSCDNGTRKRQVTCKDGGNCPVDQKPNESELCAEKPCPKWFLGEWSKCSRTCGRNGGIQSRSVSCSIGDCLNEVKPVGVRQCGMVPCPKWSPGRWTDCSKTCGGGRMTRVVICKNKHVGNCSTTFKPRSRDLCGAFPCPKWLVGRWGACSRSCGGGTQSRAVYCKNNYVGKCILSAKPNKVQKCGTSPCPEWSTGEWSECSRTCGGGTQTRAVTCKNSRVGKCLNNDKPEQSKKCKDVPCPEWPDGGGKDKPEKSKKCGGLPCPEWSAGEWSKCSKTCGGGIQTRTVFCKNSHLGKCSEKDKPEKSRKCNDVPCPEWSTGEWTKCSKTCAGGTKIRTVTCNNSHVGKCLDQDKPKRSTKCGKFPCPEWSAGQWSKCSQTCGGGTKSRTVTCKNSHVGRCLQKDKPDKSKKCNDVPCPEWSVGEWSKCSKTCSGGTKTRTVTCKNSHVGRCPRNNKPERSTKCGKFPCPEWTAGQWGRCSKSCGGGTKTRVVTCKNSHVGRCLQKHKPESSIKCGYAPCPEWSAGEWSKCSKTCGGGTKNRAVECKNNHDGKCSDKDKPERSKQCGDIPCPEWSPGQWSKCSKSCGGGTKTRKVTCKNSHVGKCLERGKPVRSEKCGELPCPEWYAGQWSKCSKTCDGGTKFRTVTCRKDGRCLQKNKPERFLKCGKLPCPEWYAGQWTKCSKSCGGGIRTRTVTCRNNYVGKCQGNGKPAQSKRCGGLPCPEWFAGRWSKCSKTCGGGTKFRTVTCKNNHIGRCLQKNKPERFTECGNLPCPEWSAGQWSKCSKTCGGGTKTRTVTCKNSRVGRCLLRNKPERSTKCGRLPCPKWSVGQWSKCSKTCGGGIKTRTVLCRNNYIGKCPGNEKPAKSKRCGKLPCPEWSASQWTKCSKSCDGGIQTRTVTCKNNHVGKCSEKDKLQRSKKCRDVPCPEWSIGEWSKCSKTCGGGSQIRTVICKNSHVGRCLRNDKPDKSQKCNDVPCPEWSAGEWSSCSKTCDGGIQTRTVTCKNSHIGKCLDNDKPDKSKKCNDVPCPEWSTGAWSKCSKTCGGGTKTRTVTCKNNHIGRCLQKNKPERSTECGKLPCPEWSASQWTKCSKSCGGGIQTRTVTCKNNHVGKCSEKDKLQRSKKCGDVPCPEWSIGEWSKCSKTCGGGSQTRTVICKNSHVGRCLRNDKPEKSQKCNDVPCPEWSAGEWSSCSKSCGGGGTKSRTVTCKNNHVGRCLQKNKPERSKMCSGVPCPTWSTGQWSKCSKTCGGGTKARTVTCKNSHFGKCLNKDKPEKFQKCGELPCPEWSTGAWSKCSKTCGGGVKTRTVTCRNSNVGRCLQKDKPKRSEKCNDVPCPEWSTSAWSKCSKTCGGGTKTRTVTCKNNHIGRCLQKNKPERSTECGKLPCPEWSAGQWSKCSKTCGGGIKTRSVICINNHVGKCPGNGKPEKSQRCGESPCPEWSAGEWSKCSRTCDGGTKTRTVTCKNNHIGRCLQKNKPERSTECGKLPCPEWSAGQWSKCSKTCGGGTKTRTATCKNSRVGSCLQKNKPERSTECGKLPCPEWSAGQWSKCSKTCGGGTKTRTVTCKNSHVGRCLQKNKPDSSTKCGELPCPEWSAGQWTKCSKTCGGGIKTRTVTCKNSHVGKCLQKNKPESSTKCGELPCPEWSAGQWSKCSKTCGGGIKTRTVICRNNHVGKCPGNGKPAKSQRCGESPCPEWSTGEWSKCSRTCGGGTKTRTVTCKNNHIGRCLQKNKPERFAECGKLPCPEWFAGQWSKCSKTCGGGTKTRTVTCKNSHIGRCLLRNKPERSTKCGELPCPEWSAGEWGKCSSTCDGGTKTRTVLCKNSHVGRCMNKDKPKRWKKCNDVPCPQWSVGQWTKCSKTCGDGTKTRVVACKNSHVGNCPETDKPERLKQCGKLPCPEWSTGEWSKCSKTCGGGVQTRTVSCKNSHVGKCLEKDKPEQSKKCGELPCPEWSAGQWGKCSKTCGGGIKFRTVSCRNSHVGKCLDKDKPERSTTCGKLSCPEWSAGQWSKCSKTCGGGTKTRIVICKNSHVGRCLLRNKPERSTTCGKLPCPEWSASEWSKCSKTCGGGIQARLVTCKNSHVGKCLNREKPAKSKKCGELPCPEWSAGEWSGCSKTCGGGTKTRTVTCKNNHIGECLVEDKPERSKECGDVPCPQWSGGEWGKCSRTCGGGIQIRTVVCRNSYVGKCLDKNKPDKSKKCNKVPCPDWFAGEWSKCPKTCGGGIQTRTVVCRNSHVGKCLDNDKPDKSKKCNDAPCPDWFAGEWSECSRTCGVGTKTRTVTCKNNHVGKCLEKYKPKRSTKCGDVPCPEWAVGQWSKCSKTCGGGTKTRTVTCTNNHVGRCLAKDKPSSSTKCGDEPCPEWSAGEWSKCSKTCGGGTKTRTVTCKNNHIGRCPEHVRPLGSTPCGAVLCPTWLTGNWSKCSKTCGSGERVRKVWCSGDGTMPCNGSKPVGYETCNPAPCPVWVTGPWSKCTFRRCGMGKRYRTVSCTGETRRSCNRKGRPVARESCKVECPEWRTSKWSECLGSCKASKLVRRVWCEGGNRKCKWNKRPRETMACVPADCLVWSVGSWSACPVTCGGSIRGRSVRCINNGTGQSTQGCEKQRKPPKLQACALTGCPDAQDMTKSISSTSCHQAKDDTYFCNLLLKPSLSKLCEFKQWRNRCCRNCAKAQKLSLSGFK